jgi:hypothetical protein
VYARDPANTPNNSTHLGMPQMKQLLSKSSAMRDRMSEGKNHNRPRRVGKGEEGTRGPGGGG